MMEICTRRKFTISCELRGQLETWDVDEYVSLIKECSCYVCKFLLSQIEQLSTYELN